MNALENLDIGRREGNVQKAAENQMYQRMVSGENLDIQRALVYQRLKDHGYRLTNQRKLIIDVILEHDCTCCKDIFYEVIKKDPTIGVATVYRMMKSLEEIGAIDRRQMFKLCFDSKCEKPGACTITFDDNTEIVLSAREWAKVVREGLKSTGHLKNVKGVEVRKCNECDYSW